MADNKEGIASLRDTIIEEPEDGVFSAYGNVINLNWTLTDVRIRVGELIHVPNSETPTWDKQDKVILEKAAITLPWYQAKVLRDLLNDLIRSYEKQNGEIVQPKLAPAPE